MLYAVLQAVHVLAVVVWVGGMVFVHFFLRPAAAQVLPPAQRLALMGAVLNRFFAAVLGAVALVLASGLWMIGRVAKETVQSGGSFSMPPSWTVMAGLGIVMMLVFGHIRAVLYPRLRAALAAEDLPRGAAALDAIRRWVAVNLGLGIAVILSAILRLPA